MKKCAKIDFFGAVWYNKYKWDVILLPRLNRYL